MEAIADYGQACRFYSERVSLDRGDQMDKAFSRVLRLVYGRRS